MANAELGNLDLNYIHRKLTDNIMIGPSLATSNTTLSLKLDVDCAEFQNQSQRRPDDRCAE